MWRILQRCNLLHAIQGSVAKPEYAPVVSFNQIEMRARIGVHLRWLFLCLIFSSCTGALPLERVRNSEANVSWWHDSLPSCSRYSLVSVSEVKELLERHWRVDAHGLCLSVDGECGHRDLVYGEVTVLGARQLGCALFGQEEETKERVVFADLGSGAGRLATQIWMENRFLEGVVGVEISLSRHQAGMTWLYWTL